jgi:prepilin-type N-terminal cleavage/methylation domain-containing protein
MFVLQKEVPVSPQQRRGFSLLELLAVVTILGIIAVIVIPRILTSGATSKENACFSNKTLINKGIEDYYWQNGSFPATISVLSGAIQFPDGIPNCPVSGAAYTISGTTNRVSGHTTGSH